MRAGPFFRVAAGMCAALLLTVLPSAYGAEAAPLPKPPEVRVLVADSQSSLTVSVHGAYVIRALPSLKIIQKGLSLPPTKVQAGSGNTIVFGKKAWALEAFRIEPSGQRDLFLKKSRFRGNLDISRGVGNTLSAVNRLPIDDYLYGVLHHEVSPWWPMEALMAQAIAARTYALYQVQVSKAVAYDLKSGTSSQVYGGSTTERYRSKAAVDKTRGLALTYQGKLFPTYFHATCAGITAAASELWRIDLPPLAGKVRCGYCKISPHYYWKARIPLAEMESRFTQNGRPVGRVLDLRPVTRTPSERVGSLKVIGTARETVVAAKDFRVWMGGDKIRSAVFTVKLVDDAAEFTGRGWGHGVGLCQWGSLGQALTGKKYKEILQFYYPASEMRKVYETV